MRCYVVVLFFLSCVLAESGFYILSPETYKRSLRDDYDWAVANVPFIDLPEYPEIEKIYYYRWRNYKKHITPTPEGWVITEFLYNVPWAGKYNTIPAASGHHIMEGRWIHNTSYLDDYITFWFRRGGAPRRYTSWIAWAAWNRHMVVHNTSFITDLLPDFVDNLRGWSRSKLGVYGERVCWYQNDGLDAMEVSISGSGCRPTINSVIYGEATAILEISRLAANGTAMPYAYATRDLARRVVVEEMWNPEISSFAVIPLPGPSGVNQPPIHATSGCPGNGTAPWPLNQTVSVRELLAYIPWYFSLSDGDKLIDPSTMERYEKMWRQLFDPLGFKSKWGLRTAEWRHPCYNYSWAHHDCWNGPTWPYETARVLTGMANLLNDYPGQKAVSTSEYFTLLQQYTTQHTKTYAPNDTAVPPGSGHVFEVVHPDLGYWINRYWMYQQGSSMRNVGDFYNHSTFVDLILSGLLGLRPSSSDTLVVNPLIPADITHFAVDHVLYHSHIISVVWDADGSHYNRGTGLQVLVDGKVKASSPSISKLTVSL